MCERENGWIFDEEDGLFGSFGPVLLIIYALCLPASMVAALIGIYWPILVWLAFMLLFAKLEATCER